MSKEIEITEEMFEVCAKAFYEDCKDDEDYPHKNWQEQAKEFKDGLDTNVSRSFLKHVYEINTTRAKNELN